MTTIVYRDGTLAADRRVSHGDSIVADTYRKVFETHDGWYGAWCGAVVDGHAFQIWADDLRDKPPPKGHYTGVLVSPKGVVHEFENGVILPRPRKKKFFAWGSGANTALGALHAGADARKAVLIAQKVDAFSGGGVDSIKIKTK